MSYASQFALIQDQAFIDRVRTAMMEAAISISNEADTTAFHKDRVKLASQVAADPSTEASRFAEAVATDNAVATAASDPPIEANVTDGQIDTAVSIAWNTLAGARS